MKKTIITLLALAGVAAAAEHTLTTGIEYDNTLYNGYSDPNVAGLTYTYKEWPGKLEASSLTFTIELGSLFGANNIADTDLITLNALKVKVHPDGWCMDNNREVTLSVEGKDAYSYNHLLNPLASGGELTISSLNWEGLTKNDTIVFTIDGNTESDGTPANYSVALASTSGTWKGVSTFDTTSWADTKGLGSNAAPLVSLAVTTSPNAVPEPATATLSLMALAGLAARRRRK